AYFHYYDIDNCKMVLRKQTINGLSAFISCDHQSNDRFDFFSDKTTRIGFLKSEIGYVDLGKYAMADSTECFTIKKQDLMAFNAWAVASTPQNYMIASWHLSKEGLILTAEDTAFNVKCERTIPVSNANLSLPFSFVYNVEIMNRMLKALPSDTLIF